MTPLDPQDFYSPCECNNDTVRDLVERLNACQVERDAALYQLRQTVEELNNQESS